MAFCDAGGVFQYSTETWELLADFEPHRTHCPPRGVVFDPGGNYSAVLDGGSGHLRDLRRLSLSY